jgi:hypothetical protein
MTPILNAASQGSLVLYTLALAGLVLAALLAIVVWLVRERIEARRRYDQTLEKRLQAGSSRMEGLERELRGLQERFISIAAEKISGSQCDAHRTELRCQMERISESSMDVRTSIVRLEGRVDEGFRHVSRLLSCLVRVPGSIQDQQESS